MSVRYIPVQWNRNKWIYDIAMLAGVVAFIWIFLNIVPGWLDHGRPVDGAIRNARAFGLCAFTMLSVILSIGPLARLDKRFLPLLYNRRHFGVMTLFVALTHVGFILGWYYSFSRTPQLEALLTSNESYAQVAGFPFELFGVFALIALMVLAFTSHDFWMKFLTPPIWKRLHYLIYPAYAAVLAHIAWGILLNQQNHGLTAAVILMALTVAGLHVAAAIADRRGGDPDGAVATDGWVRVAALTGITDGGARVARLPNGDRVAVFRYDGQLSAISNACAHQNGPLGEGQLEACLVTCPWHGFQYDVRNGRSPAPFTETVPTYEVALRNGDVLVNPKANPPGTETTPAAIPMQEAPE